MFMVYFSWQRAMQFELFKSAAEAGAPYSRRHARKPGDHDPVQDTEA